MDDLAFADLSGDGEYVDLTLKYVNDGGVVGVILTDLPEDSPLSTGNLIELLEDDISTKRYSKDRTVN